MGAGGGLSPRSPPLTLTTLSNFPIRIFLPYNMVQTANVVVLRPIVSKPIPLDFPGKIPRTSVLGECIGGGGSSYRFRVIGI